MKKSEVLAMFPEGVTHAARELRMTRQGIFKWPDDEPLPSSARAKVISYMVRTKRSIPKNWMPK